MNDDGRRLTIISPSAAARRKEKNFVIDENLSLVGYVIAVKLTASNTLVEEELTLGTLRISSEPLRTDDIVVHGME